MNKKQSAEWYIAGTHWLTSMIFAGITGAIALFLLAVITQDPTVLLIGTIVAYPLLMWAAVKYSANFINKRYVIANPQNIVNLSSIFLLIVAGGYRGYAFANGANGALAIASAIGFFAALVVFYLASKKYVLKNN